MPYKEKGSTRRPSYSRHSEDELYEKFREFMEGHNDGRHSESRRRYSDRDRDYRSNRGRSESRYMKHQYGMDDDEDEHFDEREAYDTVEEMYHVKGDKKYVGEKYSMDKAHQVYNKLEDAHEYTPCDVYVAINAQYHDYCELFEKWFGSNFDDKLIASAVDFWFDDDDFEGNKVWKYFNEM